MQRKKIKKHKTVENSPEKRVVVLKQKNEALRKEERDNEWIFCHICSTQFLRKNLKKHLKKHLKEAPKNAATLRSGYVKSQKRKRKISGVSEDVFARGMVVSGGAYGLGKNRKH